MQDVQAEEGAEEPEEAKQEEEVEEWDTDVVAVRMICINNKEQFGTKTIKIQMEISEDANYFCPVTELPTSINATYEKDTVVLIKKDPFKDWGHFAWKPIFPQPEQEAEPERNQPVAGEQ